MTAFATLSDLMRRLREAWTSDRAREDRLPSIAAASVINTITCPHCRAALPELMEEDACVIFIYCPKCHDKVEMRPGDCCVFRSYGERACLHPVNPDRARFVDTSGVPS